MRYLRAIRRLESRWTTVDGLLLHYRVSRDPPPPDAPAVVLVHGLAVSSRYMVPIAHELADRCRVYAPDLPGFGKSGTPHDVLSVSELAEALGAWMQAVGLARAALIGNSMGCQIIADFALRYPERVDRAVMIGPTVDPHGRTLPSQAFRLALDVLREPPSLWIIQAWDYLRFGPWRTIRTFRSALRDPMAQDLSGIRVPVLVVRGARDPIVPQRWAEEAANRLPLGQLVVVPGAAHAVNYNAPRALARIVLPFLEEGWG